MIKINKDKVAKFISSPSVGEATSATHQSPTIRKIREREPFENDFFSSVNGENLKGIKSNMLLDKKDDNITVYLSFNVTSISSPAQNNDIFIGYDGESYLFGMNEDIQLADKKVPKKKDSVYAHLAEIYEAEGEIPKELKFVLSKISLGSFTEVYDLYKGYEKKLKKEEVVEKEVKAPIQKTESNIENIINKNIESNSMPQQAQVSPMVQTIQAIQTVASNVPQMSPERKQIIDQFIRNKALNELKEKEESKLNFRNIDYGTPLNDAEKAIMLHAGSNPVILVGGQGTGKSWIAKMFTERLESKAGVPVSFYGMVLEKNMDRADIVGSPVLKDDAFNYQKMAEAFMSARDKNLTVFFIDEIFRMKDMGIFFNLFGETHYSLDTGRQLEIVELVTEDIEGNLQTSHFSLLDRKVTNPNLIIQPTRVQLLKNADDISFKKMPEQKIKDRLALGEIPIIYREDYAKNNLDALKVSSFYTTEIIKAPKEYLTIIAAGNVGKDFISHFKLGEDRAFDSRFEIHQMDSVELPSYLRAFEEELKTAKDKNYLMWDKTKIDIDKEIKNVTGLVKTFYSEIFKLIKQGSFGTASTFSYRNFTRLAETLSKHKDITSQTIYDCLMLQKNSVITHAEDNVGLVPVQAEKVAYELVAKKVLGLDSGKTNEKTKQNSKDASKAIEAEGVSSGINR